MLKNGVKSSVINSKLIDDQEKEEEIFENVTQLRYLAMLEEKKAEDADEGITKLCEDVENYEKERKGKMEGTFDVISC